MQADGAMQSRPTPGDLNPAATLRFSAPTLATRRLNRDRAVSARPAASCLAFSSPATRLILTDAAPPAPSPAPHARSGQGPAASGRHPPARQVPGRPAPPRRPGPRPSGAAASPSQPHPTQPAALPGKAGRWALSSALCTGFEDF